MKMKMTFQEALANQNAMRIKKAYKKGACAYCPVDMVMHTFPVLFRRASGGRIYKVFTCHEHTNLILGYAENQGRDIPLVTIKKSNEKLDKNKR